MSDTQNVKLGVCWVTYGGVEIGFTIGGVDVNVSTETHEVKVDQLGDTPIDEYITSRTVEIKVPMAETTIENLLTVLPGAELVTDDEDPDKKFLHVNTAIGKSLMSTAKELILHPIAKDWEDKSDDFIVYKAATAGELDYSYKLDTERVFTATFKGYSDKNGRLFGIGDYTVLDEYKPEPPQNDPSTGTGTQGGANDPTGGSDPSSGSNDPSSGSNDPASGTDPNNGQGTSDPNLNQGQHGSVGQEP